ncbi:MAG: hypothetical protein IT159_13085 [Bryobacterales bacterium]|nr:hypothetical protein [Bryobacterales bacterium]
MPHRFSRRRLLASGAAAGSLTLAARGAASSAAAPLLPTVRFGEHRVTRLIVGSNPFYGFSHSVPVLDQIMVEWNTPERVCQTLHACEQNGINTYQGNARERSVSDLARFRAAGGQLQVISLAAGDVVSQVVGQVKPIGIAHHGENTDRLFREGKFQEVHDFTRRVRQAGVMVGVSTHQPENIARIEEFGWDVDFYMGCVYNRTRTPDQLQALLGDVPEPPSEVYLRGDPARMYAVMRQTSKVCLAFKVLAAGRLASSFRAVEQALRVAFQSIKPSDCVIVGMFPRFKDEVAENAGHVRRILAAAS